MSLETIGTVGTGDNDVLLGLTGGSEFPSALPEEDVVGLGTSTREAKLRAKL